MSVFEHILMSLQALLQKNVHEPEVLDSRSAVYCKMGLYDKALSDAKRMIKSDNQDERVRQCYFLYGCLSPLSKTGGLSRLSDN